MTTNSPDSLSPNSNDLTKQELQPVRSSSASLQQLDTLNKKTAIKIKEIKSRGSIPGSITYQHEDLTIRVNEVLQFDENADKIHNYALIQHALTHKDKIAITLAEYMKLTGIKDRKTAREKLANAIHHVVGITISRNNLDKLSKQQKKYEPFTHDTVIYIDGSYSYGKGWLEFNPNLTKIMDKTTRPMIYPKKLFQLKGTAYYVLNALFYNKQVNYHNSLARQNRMKLGSILEKCPNLPTWDKVKNGNRNFGSRIIKPLKKAIEEDLTDEIECCFLDQDGKTQLHIDNLPLDNFLQCFLVVTKWKDLNTDQLDRLKKSRK